MILGYVYSKTMGKRQRSGPAFSLFVFHGCFKGLSRSPIALVYSKFLLSVTLLNDADDT